MSSFSFTPAQQDAIKSRGENLLVAAGAGSGKTSVLVERIIRWIADGHEIDRLLALTFTNAAAADMRMKIDLALSRLLKQRPDDSHLRRQQALLSQANISTIHSFCLNLLRQEYHRVDLMPNFRIAAELELRTLENKVLDDLLEEEYARPESGLADLSDAYGGSHGDQALVKLVQELYHFSLSRTQPEEWLTECAEAYVQRPTLSDYPWAASAAQQISISLASAERNLRRALINDLPEVWQKQLAGELAEVQAAAYTPGNLELKLQLLSAISFTRLKNTSKKDPGDVYAKKYAQTLRNSARDMVHALQKKYCSTDATGIAADIEQISPLIKTLCRLVSTYSVRMQEEKRRLGLIDFADMEHLMLKLLDDPSMCISLQNRFDEVLIDEYQDINEVQEAILSRLAYDGNFFAVGDVKQSIYRFRLAEPELFLDKYVRYGESNGGRRIDLNENFRSDRAVIDGVNFLFRQLMTREAAEISYDENAELHAGRVAEGIKPQFLLIDMAEKEDKAEMLTPLCAEAKLIARRIRELAAEGYAYRDMAILLRSSRNREPLVVATLAEAGIPAVADGETAAYESSEYMLIQSLLEVIDNPRQDISLVAVMRSPLFCFTPDDLMSIRLMDRNVDFWQALEIASMGSDDLAEKCRVFRNRLADWRMAAAQMGVSELLELIYRESGVYHLVGAMTDGEHRQANLSLLLDKAHQYEQSGYAGLFRFVKQLEDGRALAVRDNAARLTTQSVDAVRVMSIHKSKGLEFPVVFVAGLNSQFNVSDEQADVIFQRELGIGARVVDPHTHGKYPSLSHSVIARRLHELALAEEMRVLYVALTRARERLILTAAVRDAKHSVSGWLDDLDGAEATLPLTVLQSARRALDWFCPALLRQPSAKCLYNLVGTAPSLLTDTSYWQIEVIPLSSFSISLVEEKAASATSVDVADISSELTEQVEQALDYVYPYAEMCNYPAKWSVSALNRLARTAEEMKDATEEFMPRFSALSKTDEADVDQTDVEENELTRHNEQAALRGTAYHRILEFIRYDDVSESGVAQQIENLMNRGILSAEEAAIVNPVRIAAFFSTDQGKELVSAQRVLREIPFTLRQQLSEDDSILNQGVLDCAYLTENGWVLLDYKTGGRQKSDSELIAAYRGQLVCYAQAIRRLWREPLYAVYLCMLDAGRNIRVDVD